MRSRASWRACGRDHVLGCSHSIMPIMPPLIFQIDEILRPIAEYVGQISKPTAIDFARSCKAFEEPALRPLWENTTLVNLMYVLPEDVLYFSGPGLCVVCTLSLFADQRSTERWHVSADLPPAHPSRTREATPIRLVGQKNHRVRDRGPGFFPPGPLQFTRGRSISKPTRTPRLDRTRPLSFSSPLHVSTSDGLLGIRGNGRSTRVLGVWILDGRDICDTWDIPSTVLFG